MVLFAEEAGTSIFRMIDSADQTSKLLFYSAVIFGAVLIITFVILLILRKRYGKSKDKNYVELP